jgi:regulator of nonsense transcripts 1
LQEALKTVIFDRYIRALNNFGRADPFWQAILIGNLSACRTAVSREKVAPLPRQELNDSQARAVQHALSHRFTAIQGPPGTGKSTCAAVQALAQAAHGLRVLIVAHTNEGANNLTEKIAERKKIQPVRVCGATYQQKDISPKILPYCSHIRVDRTNQFAAWNGEKRLIKDSRVVVTTLCCSGGARFEKCKFDSIIIDEANQVLDPELLILFRFTPNIITLYGDEAQIGPYVGSMRAKSKGYEKSLIQRLAEIESLRKRVHPVGNYPHFTLTQQYRMHPALAEFPSATFYEGQVATHPSWKTIKTVRRIPFPNRDIPLVLVNVADGYEQKSSNGASILNLGEIVVVAKILRTLHQAQVQPESIGIITFYAAAVSATSLVLPQLPDLPKQVLKKVEVKTVDSYEGQEKDFVILICVRANTVKKLGFLSQKGRMNVALTRQKYGLFVVGSCETLKCDETWEKFVSHCGGKGVIVDRWPP